MYVVAYPLWELYHIILTGNVPGYFHKACQQTIWAFVVLVDEKWCFQYNFNFCFMSENAFYLFIYVRVISVNSSCLFHFLLSSYFPSKYRKMESRPWDYPTLLVFCHEDQIYYFFYGFWIWVIILKNTTTFFSSSFMTYCLYI